MQIIVIVLNVQIFQMNLWREGLQQRWVTTTLNFSLQEGGSAPTSPTDSSSNHQNEAQIRTKAVRELCCKKIQITSQLFLCSSKFVYCVFYNNATFLGEQV